MTRVATRGGAACLVWSLLSQAYFEPQTLPRSDAVSCLCGTTIRQKLIHRQAMSSFVPLYAQYVHVSAFQRFLPGSVLPNRKVPR